MPILLHSKIAWFNFPAIRRSDQQSLASITLPRSPVIALPFSQVRVVPILFSTVHGFTRSGGKIPQSLSRDDLSSRSHHLAPSTRKFVMVDIFPSVPGCKYQDEGLFSTHLRGVDRSGLHSIAGEYNPMALDQLRAAMEWGDRANTERPACCGESAS
jgi:hypothetical protein